MFLECIAMSAFWSSFNLSKKFRTFDFRGWILSLQIYFISVSQTQIGENVDELNKLKVIFWQVITVSFPFNIISEDWKFPEDSDKISST